MEVGFRALLDVPGLPLLLGQHTGFHTASAAAVSSPLCWQKMHRALPALKKMVELRNRKDQFWQSMRDSAARMHLPEHLKLCADVDVVILNLPTENEYVQAALSESVLRLRRVNSALLAEAVNWVQLAEGKTEDDWALNHGEVFLSALSHGRDENAFAGLLTLEVAKRQVDALPILQGTAGMITNVLEDVRLISKRAFDVLKYDIYNQGVPKTPEDAKCVAHRLVDAAGQTRHQFTSTICTVVGSIADDAGQ